MANAPRVLFVSKPVEPPWNDSSKNLVRDLSTGLQHTSPLVMGRVGQRAWSERIDIVPVYPKRGTRRFSPPLVDNARVMRSLVLGRGVSAWHFFFAPNPRSSLAGIAATRLRRVPSVHTVCSAPSSGAKVSRLCFADVTVALSRATERRLLDAGVPRERLRRIAPCVAPLAEPSRSQRMTWRSERNLPTDTAVLIYPGDIEFSAGAELSLRAVAALGREPLLIMACRAKTHHAAVREAELRTLAAQLGIGGHVRWIGETSEIHRWLAMADVVLLPAEDLYAKMDYPLVVLESLSLGRPVVVADGTPAAELAETGGVRAAPASVGEIAAVVGRLLEKDQERAEMGAAGHTAVREMFSPAVIAAQYESLYRELGVIGG